MFLKNFVSPEGFSSKKSLMGTVWYLKLKGKNNSNNKSEDLYTHIYFLGLRWTFSSQIISQRIKATSRINRIKLSVEKFISENFLRFIHMVKPRYLVFLYNFFWLNVLVISAQNKLPSKISLQ